MSQSHIDTRELDASITLFLSWLSAHGYSSHDPYSLWSTDYGIYAKRRYLENPVVGAALVSPIFLADIFTPNIARRSLPKHRFPIADSHFILGLCSMARETADERYLSEATVIAKSLLDQSLLKGHHGHCWGYPFNWMSKNGLWKSQTPLITTTPYCFEAFLALFDATKDSQYAGIAQSVAHFAMNDLQETEVTPTARACSYSPIDSTKVINANAYRAMILTETWRRFGSRSMIDTAKRNVNFVMESQRDDGSWWYAMENTSDEFVDNFHSCLVLKNLIKINRTLGFRELWLVIAKGYEFYLNALIDEESLPRPFARSRRISLVSREMYDFAEGINLGVLMHRHFPTALDTNNLRQRGLQCAQNLASTLISDYQLPDGHYVSKEHFGFIRNTTPYIRWPQAQCFHALTQLRSLQHAIQTNCSHPSAHQETKL